MIGMDVDLDRPLRGQPASDRAELAACRVLKNAAQRDAAAGDPSAAGRLAELRTYEQGLRDAVGVEPAN
jgi:hypothetical protein